MTNLIYEMDIISRIHVDTESRGDGDCATGLFIQNCNLVGRDVWVKLSFNQGHMYSGYT